MALFYDNLRLDDFGSVVDDLNCICASFCFLS